MSIRDELAGHEVLIVVGEYENCIGIYTNRRANKSRNWIVQVAGQLIEYAPEELRTFPDGKKMPGIIRPEDVKS